MAEVRQQMQYPDVARRIAQNRRKIVLVVLLSAAALMPFVLGVAYLAAAGLIRLSGSPSASLARQVSGDEYLLRRMGGQPRGESSVWLEHDLERKREELARSRRADFLLLLKLMPLPAVMVAVLLGLLLWAAGKSPATRVLAELGASPAGSGEAEVARLVESISARAGVPPPKLYVIPSNAPNLLCGGTNSRNAMIAVTRGALKLLDPKELEAALAHGVSHIANYDIRLNGVVATVASFLKIPFQLLRGQLKSENPYGLGYRRKLLVILLAISPVGIYIFFVAPILGLLIRAVASRELEFAADADAASLTQNPEGMLTTLAKIGGAYAAVAGDCPSFTPFCFTNPRAYGWLRGDFRATPPPLAKRIESLAQSSGAANLANLKEAVERGKLYGREHPSMNEEPGLLPGAGDEFAALSQGNAMGRVYRLLASEPVPVYETNRPGAVIVAWVKPDHLVVGFDDPGGMRQITTAEEQFGYIHRTVKVEPVEGVLPQEVYDPKMCAAAEQTLPPREAAPSPGSGLTRQQIWIVVAFGTAVFLAATILLVLLSRR